jgi:hypothetical protein
MFKKAAEKAIASYDTVENGMPVEVEDTSDWANFGDDNAPGCGDTDNTAFFETRAVVDSCQYYVESDKPEERIGPLLSESDLEDYRKPPPNEPPAPFKPVLSENLSKIVRYWDDRPIVAKILAVDGRPCRPTQTKEWHAANYPRLREPSPRVDAMPIAPIDFNNGCLEGQQQNEPTAATSTFDECSRPLDADAWHW